MGCINNEQHFMLFAHNGSNNHGCEALLRTITEQIKSEFEQSRISLCSFHPDEDQNANVSNINKYINHYDTVKRHSFDHIAAAINRRTVNNPYFNYSIMQKHIIKEAQNNDVCISIGGDVYCYKKPYIYYTIDSHIKKAGKKLVLWGCSVERDAFDEDMKKDFERFDLIMPRESITTELLTEKLGSNKIKPITDPAFLMQPEFLPLPENFEKGNMIGINVSPLSAGYEKVNGMTLRSVHALINHIIKNTGHNIALIPHVVRDPLGDMQCLTELYNEFKSTNRVVLILETYNAPQLKGVISQCELFIGARTHATIAAYSTTVPTLVLGYSVKAKGIARDLFGDEKGLVLPVNEIDDENTLISAFNDLYERKDQLKQTLIDVLPSYIQIALSAVKHLKPLL